MAIGSGASLLSDGVLVVTWRAWDPSYATVYAVAGGATVAVALFCLLAYPQFEAPGPQHESFVLRRRYWL